MARNQFLFDESTIAAKPKWLQRQLAGIIPAPPQADCTPSRAEPECLVRNAPVESDEASPLYSGRVSVRVVSYRKRLCDPDNLCVKALVDCLRYSGIIPNDRPEDIALSVAQEKVRSAEEERTEIELTPLA